MQKPENIDAIIKHLENHRMVMLDEQRDVMLNVNRKVLELSI